MQVVEPDIKDPKLRYHEQSSRFAYTETLNGGCVLLHEAGQKFAFQGLYVIPQVVNPAALSKAAPDVWHVAGKGAGTVAKDIWRSSSSRTRTSMSCERVGPRRCPQRTTRC